MTGAVFISGSAVGSADVIGSSVTGLPTSKCTLVDRDAEKTIIYCTYSFYKLVPTGLFRVNFLHFTLVKNPNWWESFQLAIYKRVQD